MRYPIENPMVREPLPFEPVVKGNCEGCGLEVTEHDEYREFDGDLIHDDTFCKAEYMDKISDRVKTY